MVTHPWYVFHVPGTHTYVPIWTVVALLLVVLAIVVVAIAIIASLSGKRHAGKPD